MNYRNISAIMDHEIHGKGLKSADECKNFVDYYDLFFPKTMKLNPVDVALQVTLLNRVYIIKSMVEHLLLPQKISVESKLQEFLERLKYTSLNSNIKNGFDELKNHQYFYLYPYFFQVFYYVFGGFIMEAKHNEEYQLLSTITGLPVAEINNAFTFWDKLYPINGSWMQKINPHGGMTAMKMTPAPLRGVGVNFRRHLYAPQGEEDSEKIFDNLKDLVGVEPYSDMIKWNNAAFEELKQDVVLHQITTVGESKSTKRYKAVEEYLNKCGRYVEVKTLKDIAAEKRKPNFSVRGFVGMIDENDYDLYIVKSDNRLIKHPMINVISELHLNQVAMQKCFVLGTDESIADNIDDTIWVTCRIERTNLTKLEPVLKCVDGLK